MLLDTYIVQASSQERYISYLQNAPRNILPSRLFYQRSKPGFKVIVTLLIPMLE
jgi:hypothetical protein